MNVDFTVFKEGQPLKTIRALLPVVIGRGTDSTLTIKHPLLSRRHCEVYEESGQVFVKDLASLNGTFVNDARVETALPLVSGSQLKLGSVEIQVSFTLGATADTTDADLETATLAAEQIETTTVAEETIPADVEEASFDLSDFEINEAATAGEEPAANEAEFDLADFEVSDGSVKESPEVNDAIAEAESLDLADFEVSTPEVAPANDMLDLADFEVADPVAEEAGPEAQVELPSLMDLAGGLDETVEKPAEQDPVAEPASADLATTDDPWAPPTEPQVKADDDDLDAFLADLS